MRIDLPNGEYIEIELEVNGDGLILTECSKDGAIYSCTHLSSAELVEIITSKS